MWGTLSLEIPLERYGVPNPSPFEHRIVRWVRRKERSIFDKVFLDYLRVKLEGGRGNWR